MRRSVLSVVVGVAVAAVAAVGSSSAAFAAPLGYYDDASFPVASSTSAAVGPDGTIYAVSGTSLATLTPGLGGTYTTTTQTLGVAPLGLAISADGATLAVSDRNTGQVYVFAHTAGSFSNGVLLPGVDWAQGLAFAPDGALLVADYEGDRLLRYEVGPGPTFSNATGYVVPDAPRWVTATADGTVFITHQSTSAVTVLHRSVAGYDNAIAVPVTGAPYGIAASDDGSVLVVSTGAPATLTRLEPSVGSWAAGATYPITNNSYGIAALPGARAVITTIGGGSAAVHIWSRQLAVTTTDLGTLTAGTTAPLSLAASGGSGSAGWSITSGALPAGLTLDADGGITGTPTVAGPYSVTVTVTDALHSADTASVTFSGSVAPAAVVPPPAGGNTGTSGGSSPSGTTAPGTTATATPAATTAALAETGAAAEPLVGTGLTLGLLGLVLFVFARRRGVKA